MHNSHGRKGLGKALLLSAMHKLKSLECTEVYVTHAGLDSEVVDPALALNQVVGFNPLARNYMWYKKLE